MLKCENVSNMNITALHVLNSYKLLKVLLLLFANYCNDMYENDGF